MTAPQMHQRLPRLPDRGPGLARLERLSRRAELRLRLNAALDRLATLSVYALLYGIAALTAVKVSRGAPHLVHLLEWGLLFPLTVLVGGVVHAALRQGSPFAGALALDRHHGLSDRVTNALSFSRIPGGERTPLMEAAIEDGIGTVDRLSPGRAVPVHKPRDTWAALALAAGASALALLEVPRVHVVSPETRHTDVLAVAPDDAELFRHVSEDLVATTTDPEALAVARRFNQLVEDLSERRLDRSEVFRRLSELDRSIDDPSGLDASALDQALDGIARELDKSALAKPVAEALADKRLGDAEQAMRDLAKKIAGAKKDVDKSKLEELRKALQKSSETVRNKGGEPEGERRSLEERRRRLLEKKQKEGLSRGEQEELDRAERRLERLDREKSRADSRSQGLSGLDQDLAKAAQDLMKDLGMSSKDLEQGAQDMNRASQQRLGQKQKEELRRRIDELRQILRQEGQAGRDRLKRMMAFGQRARGGQDRQQGQGQGQGRQGGQGQGQQGQGQGKEGKGAPGLSIGPGKPGAGSALVMGLGAAAPAPGGEPGNPGTGGGGEGGDDWGTGHDPNVRGDSSHLKGQTEDVTAVGADTGQGTAASQVIYGAAERGFAGRGYKKVFTDYQTVAEESLAKDEIPPGYRFYVRRYFQLIRPRD